MRFLTCRFAESATRLGKYTLIAPPAQPAGLAEDLTVAEEAAQHPHGVLDQDTFEILMPRSLQPFSEDHVDEALIIDQLLLSAAFRFRLAGYEHCFGMIGKISGVVQGPVRVELAIALCLARGPCR